MNPGLSDTRDHALNSERLWPFLNPETLREAGQSYRTSPQRKTLEPAHRSLPTEGGISPPSRSCRKNTPPGLLPLPDLPESPIAPSLPHPNSKSPGNSPPAECHQILVTISPHPHGSLLEASKGHNFPFGHRVGSRSRPQAGQSQGLFCLLE